MNEAAMAFGALTEEEQEEIERLTREAEEQGFHQMFSVITHDDHFHITISTDVVTVPGESVDEVFARMQKGAEAVPQYVKDIVRLYGERIRYGLEHPPEQKPEENSFEHLFPGGFAA